MAAAVLAWVVPCKRAATASIVSKRSIAPVLIIHCIAELVLVLPLVLKPFPWAEPLAVLLVPLLVELSVRSL